MTSRDRGGDNSSRASQRGNDGNQEARDMGETGQHDEDDLTQAGAHGEQRRRKGAGGMNGARGVGNNTDGVVGSEGQGPGVRDNAS